ncbi:MAG: Holliday junction branch migration protein RuvA [Clostridia bacterium]|nr:Holliday junction branch migration protein RuvA [Clostridia bacterium]
MFHYISGALTLLTPTFAVLDAGGIGFKLTISANTYGAISPAAREASTVKLYTHMAVREDAMELFGFADEQELETFRLLINDVSGVGPKGAISILSSFTPEKFAIAVCSEDKKTIARASGIGPKTAARIILELRDKMAAGVTLPSTFDAFTAVMPTAADKGGNAHLAEAQEALLVLGYSRTEVARALAGMDTASMDTEGIIRAALKKLM